MFSLETIKNDETLFKTAVSQVTPEILGSIIDHTQLSPTATSADIEKLCREANEIGSFICVNGSRIVDAKICIQVGNLTRIRGIAAVIGFPFGAELTTEKETGAWDSLVGQRADEVDMVLNYGKFLDGDVMYVENDILAVAETVKLAQSKTGKKKVLKVIQENCSLSDNFKRIAAVFISEIASKTGVHMFAKTSTGFGTPKDAKTPKGATIDDVWEMNTIVQGYREKRVPIGIKAAGGIGNAEIAVKMMLAGGCFDDNSKLRKNLSDIFRIGASAGVTIVDDLRKRFC